MTEGGGRGGETRDAKKRRGRKKRSRRSKLVANLLIGARDARFKPHAVRSSTASRLLYKTDKFPRADLSTHKIFVIIKNTIPVNTSDIFISFLGSIDFSSLHYS